MQRDFWIGEYLVSPKHNKLTLPKRTFTLEPKVMAVLCLLVKHHGEVLSREEILSTLWPNQVTEPEVATRAIFELRKVFCDDSKNPRFIETITKKGYSFIHPVTPAKSSNRNKLWFVGSASLLFMCLISAFLFAFLKLNSSNKSKQFKVFPMSSSNQEVVSAAPDSSWQSALLVSGKKESKTSKR
ncbi:winged helix-turn-helix domain-containing protein [Pseudoalteromonas sp. GB56]